MQTIEYRTMDKSKWGDGAWQQEPDKKQWLDPETNMPCLIVRNNSGALCGYAGVAKHHPLFGVKYNESAPILKKVWETVKQGSTGKRGVFTIFMTALSEDRNENPTVEMCIDVHGSLTFSGGCMRYEDAPPQITKKIIESEGICHLVEGGEDDNIWWFGFDCGHCDDWSPKLYAEEFMKEEWRKHYGTNMIYRDLAYVTTEVQSLAKQLKEIESAEH